MGKTKNIGIRLDADTEQKLSAIAAGKGITRAAVIDMALKFYVESGGAQRDGVVKQDIEHIMSRIDKLERLAHSMVPPKARTGVKKTIKAAQVVSRPPGAASPSPRSAQGESSAA
jgi:antitoxin component of RelBE/YafQ-DinJ toxin-antitoxin module